MNRKIAAPSRLLLQVGAKVDLRDNNGTALEAAKKKGHAQVVALLAHMAGHGTVWRHDGMTGRYDGMAGEFRPRVS